MKSFSCGYNVKLLIDEINFRVNKGSFTRVINPNGAKETKLFRGITNELKGRFGYAKFKEESIAKMSYKQNEQQISVVSQTIESVEEYVLIEHLSYHSQFQLKTTFFGWSHVSS